MESNSQITQKRHCCASRLETEVSIARANAKHHIVRYLVSGVWSGMLVFRMPLSQIRTPALTDGRLHFPGLLLFRSCGGDVARLHYSDERRDRNSTPGAEIFFFPNPTNLPRRSDPGRRRPSRGRRSSPTFLLPQDWVHADCTWDAYCGGRASRLGFENLESMGEGRGRLPSAGPRDNNREVWRRAETLRGARINHASTEKTGIRDFSC